MILAGDIGGTKTNVAFFNEHLEVVAEQTYPSNRARRTRRDPGALPRGIEAEAGVPRRSASRVRCATVARRPPTFRGLSIPWKFARQLHVKHVGLINDLEATAYGVVALKPADFLVLNEGSHDPHGNAAVISAGTGLGEAGLHRHGTDLVPFACEGRTLRFHPARRNRDGVATLSAHALSLSRH